MADDLTVNEAALLLETSRQTIRNLLQEGELKGRQEERSGTWRIRRSSVEGFLRTNGPLRGGRRRKSRAAIQQEELEHLREEVERLTEVIGGQGMQAVLRERDELRERLFAAEDVLARLRDAAELQRAADAERAQMVESLLAALASAERADDLRRQALQSLEDGVATTLVPGRPPKRR